MLQKVSSGHYGPQEDAGQFLSPAYLVDIVKRRIILFTLVFVLVLGIGSVVAFLIPAVYMAEGKILVESQQIPSELVRPTVSALANERIQIIEQRIMTRDKLLAIANKHQVNQRRQLSGTDLLDLMRERSFIRPLDLKLPSRQNRQVLAFTVGFEHERPDIAMRVANEFVTLILEEDVRTRTAFAAETTRFLEREAKRLEGELAAVELQISEVKRRQLQAPPPEAADNQLLTVRAEIAQKSAVYSESHPEMRALRQRLAALEKTFGGAKPAVPATAAHPAPAADIALDPLERQQEALQKNLESVVQKLSAARLGESLERGQQSERLEVIEQPTLPQKPAKPNRAKILLLVLAAAGAAAGGLVFLLEMTDSTVRRSTDLLRVADSRLIVSIPFIATDEDFRRKKKVMIWTGGTLLSALLIFVIAVIYFIPDIDLMLRSAVEKVKL